MTSEFENRQARTDATCQCSACGEQPYLIEEIRRLKRELAAAKAEGIREGIEAAAKACKKVATIFSAGKSEAAAYHAYGASECITEVEALTRSPPDAAMAEEVPPAVERIRRLEQAVRTMRNFVSGIENHMKFAMNEGDSALGETAETRRTR